MLLHHAARRKPRGSLFVPRLEPLEDRCLPSCVLQQSGGTLFILPARGHRDRIQIVDDGIGNVTIQCDGTGTMQLNHIDTIVARAPHRNASLTYLLVGPLSGTRTLDIALASGGNRFDAVVGAPLNRGAQLQITMEGGQGADQVSLNEQGNLLPGSSLLFAYHGKSGGNMVSASLSGNVERGAMENIDLRGGNGDDQLHVAAAGSIALGAQLNIALAGGAGGDTETVVYHRRVSGTLMIQELGGPGNDVQVASVKGSSGSSGTVVADLFGGGGDDSQGLGLKASPQAGSAPTFSGLVDGGAGFDSCTSTNNTVRVNCEKVILVR
jgi:hypothetical protein